MAELVISLVAVVAILGIFYTWGHFVGYAKGYDAGRRDVNNEIAGRVRKGTDR